MQALKNVLRAQVERIGEAPKLAPLQRVLELTWLTPVRSQQAAAESLHLFWSTYRRRLADATQLLTAHLWEAECALERAQTAPAEKPVREAAPAGTPAAVSNETLPGQIETPPPAENTTPAPAVSESMPMPRRHARWPWAGPAALLLIVAVMATALWGRHTTSSASSHIAKSTDAEKTSPSGGAVTLAVLPFLNMDADRAQQYLADGLTDELINRFGRFSNLRVAARTSAFVFRDKAVDVRRAAHALGVANILEGSVQRSGERLRVRVALVSAENGYELWSSEYEPVTRDLLIVEDEIAKEVIGQLQPKLEAAALQVLHERAAPNRAAHDFYLVGLQYLNRRTPADIDQAIAYFRRAIQADPAYALAWSGVAMGYAILRDYNSDAPPDTHYEDALAAARQAVALDPQQPRAHAVLGLLYEMHWQWREAEWEFLRALQLDPSDATAHQWYAMYLWFRGDMSGALKQMREAHDLDPLSPIVNTDLTRALLYDGDVDAAIAQGRAAVALEPRFSLAHTFLAGALNAKGRLPEAITELRTAIDLTPPPHPSSYLAFLAELEWNSGQRAAARKQLDELEARAQHQYVSGAALAFPEWLMGDKDRAFANLFRAAADYEHLMMMVTGFRDEAWCTDPRYAQLMRKMNLPVRQQVR